MTKKPLRQPPPKYKAIIEWVETNKGYSIKTCWIASVKRALGYNGRIAHNRKGEEPLHPCPNAAIAADIEEAIYNVP